VGELDSGVVETAENYAKERNTAWYWEALLDATIE
jgi:hypothetical protein